MVPDLAADSMILKTSSVVWSSQREPLKAAVGEAEKIRAQSRRPNPLIVGEEKVVPNITKVFRRSQNLYISFDVYDAAPDPEDSQSRHVEVSMSLFNQKGDKASKWARWTRRRSSNAPQRGPGAIPGAAEGPGAGPVRCQINVVDEVGRKFAFPRSALVVQ